MDLLRMRPAMIDSRSVSSSAPNTCTASEIGRFTYSASRRPFTRTARLSGFSRSPRRQGTNATCGTLPVPPARSTSPRRTAGAGSESVPRSPCRTDRRAAPSCATSADWPVSPPGPNSRRSRCFFGSLPNAVSSAMPNVSDNVASASRTSLRSPRAQGAMAPVGERLAGIGHHARRVEVPRRTQPLAGRARAVRRVERERARRHLGHADAAVDARHPRENNRSPSSRLLMTTMSSASCSAVSTDSVRRRSIPERTISRSTTTRSCGSSCDRARCRPRAT